MKYFKEKYLNNLVEKNLNILDVGSQDINGNYKDIFQSKNWNYVGLDMQHGDNVDLIPNNEYKWDEIENESFHVVISGQALEHIEFFWLTIEEIYRVMKKSGFLCLIAPSSGYEHRHPVDCWRFYPDGMRAIAKYVDLKVLEAYANWDDNCNVHDPLWQDCVLIAKK